MSDIPAAPYPADTKAKGWRFELDLEKVEASDTWLRAKTGAVRGALLLLWAKSWQQVPCGSLPNDDELVALLIDMPLTAFVKHRSVLMRGWWFADDGRLYHDTIVSRVLAMLYKRATDAERAARNRAKRSESRGNTPEVTHASRVTNAGLRSEFDTKHQAPDTSNTNTPPLTRASLADCEVFPIAPDWQPSEAFATTAKLSGLVIADELRAAGIAEFVAYWRTRPAEMRNQAEWEHALVKSLKHFAAQAKQPTQTTAKPGRKGSHTGFENIDYHAGVNEDGTLA